MRSDQWRYFGRSSATRPRRQSRLRWVLFLPHLLCFLSIFTFDCCGWSAAVFYHERTVFLGYIWYRLFVCHNLKKNVRYLNYSKNLNPNHNDNWRNDSHLLVIITIIFLFLLIHFIGMVVMNLWNSVKNALLHWILCALLSKL